MKTTTLLVLACLCPGALLMAQRPAVPVGAYVRVIGTARGEAAQKGYVARSSGDSVWIAPGFAPPIVLRPGSGLYLQERTASHGNAVKGLAIGGGIGMAAGIIIGVASYHPCGSCFYDPGPTTSAMAGSVVFGAAGGLVGAIIGALTRTETWRTMDQPPARPHVTVAPSPGGMSVSVQLKF